ncbi:hypothetical protein IWT140_02071 [Secundilactobacillus pentosiphilus]|uniref:Uncharacterized protein n=1 Tax=Secundilactobacillus pentosiphilus TaxID=1714682 RepID=A0A1Z5IRP2_9LACO|nr:hypothetical protein [Secundilactobacillus pentosiphilus]GAX04433.1 hypothetical protein IWT140_02071 [Secundilactobacillus pentosiphilus]
MTKQVWKKAATVILGASLVGGVAVEIPSAVTTTQAQAAAQIPYSTYTSDLSGLKAALGKASPTVQGEMAGDLAIEPKDAYTDGDSATFGGYLDDLGSTISNGEDEDISQSDYQADLNCLAASFNVFKSRLSAGSQQQFESLNSSIQRQINAYNVNDDDSWEEADTLDDSLEDYADALSNSLVSDYGRNYDGVAAKPKAAVPVKPVAPVQHKTARTAKKSYIYNLSVKKSKKHVKTAGTAKLHKAANYARIHTYKGNAYAKLNSKHNFSKTVYAPKAKTVKVTVGHYSHGHFTSVTSTKTVHIK